MMPLKRYNLTAVLLLLLGGYGSAQAAIAPDRTRPVFRGEDKSISVDLKNANSKLPYLAQSRVEDEGRQNYLTFNRRPTGPAH